MTELRCPFFGKFHTDPDAFTDCVCSCRDGQRKKEAEEKRTRLQAQRRERVADVDKAFEYAINLQNKLINDYLDITYRHDVLHRRRDTPNLFWTLSNSAANPCI